MRAPISVAVVAVTLLAGAVLTPRQVLAEPSVRDLMAQCTSSNQIQNLACRSFIDGFVAGVSVHIFNDRATYCLGRPLDDYIRAFLAVTAESEGLRAAPDASMALFQAMTGYLSLRNDCLKP